MDRERQKGAIGVRLLLFTVLATLIPVAARAGDVERFLHVWVDEYGRHGETIQLNLPLPLAEVFVPMVEAHVPRHRGRSWSRRHGQDDHIDLHRIVAAVRGAPVGEPVDLSSRCENVQATNRDGSLLMVVDERWKDSVRIRMPFAVAEAMVGAGAREIDLGSALRVLDRYRGPGAIRIESDDDLVRIWIDSDATGCR